MTSTSDARAAGTATSVHDVAVVGAGVMIFQTLKSRGEPDAPDEILAPDEKSRDWLLDNL